MFAGNEPAWLKKLWNRFTGNVQPDELRQGLQTGTTLFDQTLIRNIEFAASIQRESHTYIYEFKNAYRLQTLIQSPIAEIIVPANRQIAYETFVVSENGTVYLLKGAFRTGENYDLGKHLKAMAKQLNDIKGLETTGSSIIKGAYIRSNFYMQEIAKKPTVQVR